MVLLGATALESPALDHYLIPVLLHRDLTRSPIDFRVGNVRRKTDEQDPPEAPALEDIQLRLQGSSECSSLGPIQEDWQDWQYTSTP